MERHQFKNIVEELIRKRNRQNRTIEDIDSDDFMNFELKDGDILEARPVTDSFTNLVTIEKVQFLCLENIPFLTLKT